MCVVLTTAGGSRTFCSEDERIDEEGEIKKLDLRMANVGSVVQVCLFEENKEYSSVSNFSSTSMERDQRHQNVSPSKSFNRIKMMIADTSFCIKRS